MFSSYLIAFDTDQTDVGGICYNTNDLDALVSIATHFEMEAEYVNVLGMGDQTWDENGRLIVLDWDDSELSGPIPSEMGNLSELTLLYLDNNNLSGSIPSTIGNLTKLLTLNLHANDLSGSIPPEIGGLTNLNYLFLEDNELSGSIPSEIGHINNSTGKFNFFNNNLTGFIPNFFCNLPEELDLEFGNNNFWGNSDLEYSIDINIIIL